MTRTESLNLSSGHKIPLETRFVSILPESAIVVEASPAMWEAGLLPSEAAYVAHAVEGRRREFTAGRNCARAALRRLGLEPRPVLVGRMREPIFPPEVSGSITHTTSYCAAAVVRRDVICSIGIDAADNEPLPFEVHDLVCNSDELRMAAHLPRQASINWTTLIFSAKESFYKSSFQLAPRFIDFLD